MFGARIVADCLFHYQHVLKGHIPGVAVYAQRTLLEGKDTIAYVDGSDDNAASLREYHQEHLLPSGIGVRGLRVVDARDCSILDAIVNDPAECAWLRSQLANGATFETFTGASLAWKDCIRIIDPPRHKLRTPTYDDWYQIAQRFDDKEYFRIEAGALGLSHCFPEHRFGMTEEEVRRHLRDLLERYPKVWLKRPDMESGIGTLLISRDTLRQVIDTYLQQFLGERRLIIEAHVGDEGEEVCVASCQLYVPLAPNAMERIFFSKQYTVAGEHQGNAVCTDEWDALPAHWPEEVRGRIVEEVWRQSEEFAQHLWQAQCVGYVGFDVIVTFDGRSSFHVCFLEANVRKTAGTYAASVRSQVADSGRVPHPCVVMHACHPATARHWRDVVRVLADHPDGYGDIVFGPNSTEGILLVKPGALSLDAPGCILVAIASNIARAEELLWAALHRLEAPAS
ncbi:hypothetical protein HY734_03495 [Candidatus Uhrbacteria bacterium]|nr:hypothetical protein [Candidatus Uhrbacteria bacterium]